MRDEFPSSTKFYLARMSGYRCANPRCRRQTVGAASTGEGAINIGVAAHITAAAPGGKRYDPSLIPRERRHHSNGVWLCQTCAKLIDSDEMQFTVDVLQRWRAAAHKAAHHEVSTGVLLVPLRERSSEVQPADGTEYQPPLDLRLRDSDGDRLFFFAAKDRIPFCGRQTELNLLRGWLGEAADFSWTILTGQGGSGKSRLALELCLEAQASGWSAGFIARDSGLTAPAQFAGFYPRVPTLIVFDYVADAPQRAGELVRTLADVSRLGRLSKPVRLLLLERDASAAAWWDRFTEGQAQQMDAFRGLELQTPRLPCLGEDVQWEIVQHVAGAMADDDRAEILQELRRIDPKGRPLLVALAARALKQGKPLRQFDLQGLLNDIVVRERARWRRAATDPERLRRHENALALATMVGGLDLRHLPEGLADDTFPFGDNLYQPALMQLMSGGTASAAAVEPLEPDVLGEWIVLDLLRAHGPFDTRPTVLSGAAELVAHESDAAQSYWAAFKVKAAQDFPEASLDAELFRPPPVSTAAEIVTPWLLGLSDAIEHFLSRRPADAKALFDVAVEFHKLHARDKDLQLAAARVYFHYGRTLAAISGFVEGFAILDQLFDWARKRPEISDLARIASNLAEQIGYDRLQQGDIEAATLLFETLCEAAKLFKEMKHSEWEEVAEATASLGLFIRAFYAENGNDDAVRGLNATLWAKPVDDDAIDLAERTGQVLMQRSDDNLCTVDAAYGELKARACARPDAQAIAFWAGNVAYSLARDAQDERKFVDAVRELASWTTPRADWPDMPDVIDDAVSNEWITYDGALGRAPIEALLALMREIVKPPKASTRMARLDNEYTALKAELHAALAACEDKDLAAEIRAQAEALMRTLD